MEILSIFVIALGLSMDAFAVALGKGLNMKKVDYKWSVIIASFFGGFQALMPVIGWLLGSQFEKYISSCDHWIAFALLAIMGVKMIIESRDKNCELKSNYNNVKQLFILAIATSIDALAVGITFALIKIDILVSSLIIGLVTFILSFFGVVIGNKLGCKYKSIAELFGGIILVVMRVKILLEHMIV